MAKKVAKKPVAKKTAKKTVVEVKPSARAGAKAGKSSGKLVLKQKILVKGANGKRHGDAVGSASKSVEKVTLPQPTATLQIPVAPVPTDGKPRKNQAGLTPKELEFYRELLLSKRRELVGDMSSMEREALRSTTGSNLSNLPLHMADMGTDNYEQEFTLGLVEKDRQLLKEINVALAKIQNGTYGLCEGTGKPIGKPRLEAQPWAKHSIEYARLLERNMLRR